MEGVSANPGVQPVGAAEPQPVAEPTPAPAPGQQTATEPTPAPEVPAWVSTIDQVPMVPPQPVVPQVPPQPPQYPPTGYPYQQPTQASLDAIAADPQLVPRIAAQQAAQAVQQAVIPLQQAFEQNRIVQFQRDASQAMAFAKGNLAQLYARDPSLSIPAVGQKVQQAYALLTQRVAMGDPSAVAALAAPELPYALIAIAKANSPYQAGTPVSYTGAAVETGRGTAGKPPRQTLTEEEESLRQDWGGDAAGFTVDNWIKNREKYGE